MTPGFAEPVLGAQSSFRAMLHAMSHPGRIVELPDVPQAPAPLGPAMGALALALCDADTPLWHDGWAAVTDWLRFHTGAPLTEAHAARFLLASGAPPALAGLALGSDEAPQDGATLLLQVTALEPVDGWRLSGPGIETSTSLRVSGAPPGFVAERAALAALFPRGLDIMLCAGRHIVGLPRTTNIRDSR
jgi:alpha-D-ribose 1-methylphosphonate 5-triphosphate synthase subunit PhnH